MSLFRKNLEKVETENAQLKEQVEQLQTELTTAKGSVVSDDEQVATLTNEKAILETKLEDGAAEKEALETKVSGLEATLETERKDASEKIADFDGSVAKEVAKQIADNGLEEGLENDGDEQESILDKFNNLEGSARTQFYLENRKEIQALTIFK